MVGNQSPKRPYMVVAMGISGKHSLRSRFQAYEDIFIGRMCSRIRSNDCFALSEYRYIWASRGTLGGSLYHSGRMERYPRAAAGRLHAPALSVLLWTASVTFVLVRKGERGLLVVLLDDYSNPLYAVDGAWHGRRFALDQRIV